MITNDYEPEELQFVLPEVVKDTFPLELTFGNAENEKEIIKAVNEHFNVMFPENELAMRYMDNFEKDEIRKKYCELVEKELPSAEAELLSAKLEAKRLKADAEEALNSVSRQIKDYAAKVTEGTKEKKLPPTRTFRIALNGYYLFYSVINGRVLLVKTEKISSYDKSSLWAQEDRNRTAMMELFGLDFPAVEKPDDDDFDNEHDMIPDDSDDELGNEDDLNDALGCVDSDEEEN